jgi:hypothetical protein
MSFPSSGATLADKWARIQSDAARLKSRSATLVAASQITRREALEYQNALLDIRADLETLTAGAASNGLQAYAQAQVNDPSLNIATEYTTMRNALDALTAWLVTNFPNTTGELRVYTFVSSRVTDVQLTAGELTAYKAQLNGLIATIN